MVASPEYSEEKQAKFIPALCVLHNFISTYDRDVTDVQDTNHRSQPGMVVSNQATPSKLPRPPWVSEEEELSASVRRDRIAAEMWADYQRYLMEKDVE